ncbi:hypothetical protein ACLESD_48055, partial [Pyxidicoccus sp. 3LFB2]
GGDDGGTSEPDAGPGDTDGGSTGDDDAARQVKTGALRPTRTRAPVRHPTRGNPARCLPATRGRRAHWTTSVGEWAARGPLRLARWPG